MNCVIVTNNPKVRDRYGKKYDMVFIDDDLGAVLTEVRDRIHNGAKLLTHPLSGSVKPGETPYKSIALSQCGGQLDMDSMELIENAIMTYGKFSGRICRSGKERFDKDFQEIDLTLISSALLQ